MNLGQCDVFSNISHIAKSTIPNANILWFIIDKERLLLYGMHHLLHHPHHLRHRTTGPSGRSLPALQAKY
ncbi:hypothetical protein U3516DRAFT_742334 [Neocallimastix sp. 'constans']